MSNKVDYKIVVFICDILGVKYDYDYLNSLNSECEKVNYLFSLIYKFLGGE
jgi:uncharacterized protein YycO